jgi:hypothetical protein
MPVDGQTGLVVPVPTADALLGLVRVGPEYARKGPRLFQWFL